ATGYHPMPSEHDEQRDAADTQLPGEYDLFDLMAKVTEDNLHAPVDSGPPVGREAL
ncbi:PbsX family transcriptional regulator, partial [Salmonella enterica subsp. enterica]|nr:PbsX family transcriptional regulator [Salmonella enterica subsp. enterica serovar Cairina]